MAIQEIHIVEKGIERITTMNGKERYSTYLSAILKNARTEVGSVVKENTTTNFHTALVPDHR